MRRLAVMIDRELRVPFDVRLLHVPRFFLRKRQRVAVQVKAVMVNASPDRPRLAMLDRVAVGAADRDRVVPRRKTFVPVRIFAGHDQHDGVLQNIERRRFVRCGKLIDDLHKRLERRRFVAVDRVCHPGDRRIVLRDRVRLGRDVFRGSVRRAVLRLYLIEPRDIFRRGDGDDVLHPVLVRRADVEDLYAVRCRLGDRSITCSI